MINDTRKKQLNHELQHGTETVLGDTKEDMNYDTAEGEKGGVSQDISSETSEDIEDLDEDTKEDILSKKTEVEDLMDIDED